MQHERSTPYMLVVRVVNAFLSGIASRADYGGHPDSVEEASCQYRSLMALRMSACHLCPTDKNVSADVRVCRACLGSRVSLEDVLSLGEMVFPPDSRT